MKALYIGMVSGFVAVRVATEIDGVIVRKNDGFIALGHAFTAEPGGVWTRRAVVWFARLRRRSGCVPAEPYPPLKFFCLQSTGEPVLGKCFPFPFPSRSIGIGNGKHSTEFLEARWTLGGAFLCLHHQVRVSSLTVSPRGMSLSKQSGSPSRRETASDALPRTICGASSAGSTASVRKTAQRLLEML
jgi:hypothetical protein